VSAATGCILCGEPANAAVHRQRDRLYRTTREEFTIVRCLGCGLARLDPQPPDVGRFYPEGYWYRPGRLEETYRRLVVADHIRFARRALGAGRRVLDVGCGSGLFLRELQNQLRAAAPRTNIGRTKVVGMDASPRAAALAWRSRDVPATAADLTRAPFTAGSFDLICMFHVLEHLPDPVAYVDAARSLLAPGGRLVVQTPNLDCWQYRIFGDRWSGLDVPRHLYNFRRRDLLRMLEGCGFRVVRIKDFSWRDNPAGLATTIAPHLEPVARAARGARPTSALWLWLYFALTVAALPFAALEALAGQGSSIMVEAAVAESGMGQARAA
jgi:SAM-dependent methyltransferase